MIDEFNNDIPYDFKNILFTGSAYDGSITYTNAFTFSYTENSTIKDASLLGISKSCYHNMMKECINSNKQQLNFNVFYSNNTSFDCYNNTFDTNCAENIFGNYFRYNTFGSDCIENVFGSLCTENIFGEACFNNTFGDDCHYNTLGNGCYTNTFGGYCANNTFGDDCFSNTFGRNCTSNIFGNTCASNTFGDNCYNNTFGSVCANITFGDSSLTINYCEYIIIDNGCSYLYINSTDTSASSNNCLKNVHIHLGVKGASSIKTITIPDRNLPYETNVYMDANGNVYMVVNEGEGDGSYETATEAEIRALFSTQVTDSQGNVITDTNDQIITVS